MDEKSIAGKSSHHDFAVYNANVNSFARVLEKLGVLKGGKAQQPQSISDILRRRA